MASLQEFERTIAAASRRLNWTKLLQKLSVTLLIAAVCSCAILAARRVWPLAWANHAVAALGAVALLAGVLWGLLPRIGPVRAALHLDKTLGLHERLSTAAVCLERADPPAREVLRDALGHLPRIDLARHCPVHLPREALALFAAILCAAALAGLPQPNSHKPAGRDIVKTELELTIDSINRALETATSPATRRSLNEMKKQLERSGSSGDAATKLAAMLGEINRTIQNKSDLDDVAKAAFPDAQEDIEERDERVLKDHATEFGDLLAKNHILPEQRDLIAKALQKAIEGTADPELKQALEDALAALKRNDGDKAAEALEQILLSMAAEARLKELEALHERLAMAKERIDAANGGDPSDVNRGVQGGGDAGGPPAAPNNSNDPDYWQKLPVARGAANDAIAAGAVPERHRELVRRYFARTAE